MVNENVAIIQIIMPEARAGDGSVLRDKSVDDLSVPCLSSKLLFLIWTVERWATE